MSMLQAMDPPCAGAILRRACPDFLLRRHLPLYAVGFLSAAFLRAERANAQPSGGEKREPTMCSQLGPAELEPGHLQHTEGLSATEVPAAGVHWRAAQEGPVLCLAALTSSLDWLQHG